MANDNINYSGAINGVATTNAEQRALWLKLFAGDILRKLPQMRSTLGMTIEKTLSGGKEFQFPYTGKIDAKYHVPGVELTGQTSNNAERVIGLDDLMVVDRATPKIDRWMQHFDDRSAYADQMSESLGILMDEHVFHEAVLGARASSVVTGNGADGTQIVSDKFKIDSGTPANAQTGVELAAAIRSACKTAAATFKVANVSDAVEKVMYIPWNLYYEIIDAIDPDTGFSFFNKDYASGNIETPNGMPPVYGIRIQGTNNLNTTNLTSIAAPTTAVTGVHFFHQVDLSKTVGIIMCKGAVATVKASDITIEVDPYSARRKSQLVTADYMAGHGWLRPEMLMELVLDTTAN